MNHSSTKEEYISIIVPLKNKAAEIGRCIDSILSQTHQNFELIIVDGHSTDGSLEIVECYTDKRIKIINQKTKGAAAGRNEGIDASKGELIAFLDADDEYLPDFLEVILYLANRFPEAGMYGTKGFSVNNGIINNKEDKSGEFLISEYFKEVVKGELFSMSGTAIRRTVFEEIGKFNESLVWYEDVEMFGRVGYYYPVAHSIKPAYIYHITASNKITDSTPIIPEEHPLITFFESQPIEVISERNDYEDILVYIDSLHLKFAGAQLLKGDKKGARRSLASIKHIQFKKQTRYLYVISIIPRPILRYLGTHTKQRRKISTLSNKIKDKISF